MVCELKFVQGDPVSYNMLMMNARWNLYIVFLYTRDIILNLQYFLEPRE